MYVCEAVKTTEIMSKTNKVGRPKGAKKTTLNLSLNKDLKKRLQKRAIDQGCTASVLVELALSSYGI